MAWQQLAIHCLDLMREGLELGEVDGKHRVEQVRKLNPPSLRGQPEQMAVAVERPCPTCLFDLKGRLTVTKDEPFGNVSGHIAVRQCEGTRPRPSHGHNGDRLAGYHPENHHARCQLF
jgi:hypothetical protein